MVKEKSIKVLYYIANKNNVNLVSRSEFSMLLNLDILEYYGLRKDFLFCNIYKNASNEKT